ncbi:hypothetical protein A3K63_00600 [Candidatus Micrarchaeota archaeon RBG_16_49_10]|nr:MAG: hypothetical protein A3K63_00600 [Candidatus Micrarchaeota archaeon RBG_16_49_10]
MKYDGLFLIFLIVYSSIVILTFNFSSITSDEGTHLLLGLFYRDLIKFILTDGVSGMYDFSINYLITYPKLTIHYPPLYQTLVGITFIFSESIYTARVITLLFSLGSMVFIYKIGKFLYDEKTGFLSTVFLGFSPPFFFLARSVYPDSASFFFFFISIWFCLLAFKTNKKMYYILYGIVVALGFLTKWTGIFSPLVMGIYLIFQKNPVNKKLASFKYLFISGAVCLLLLSPYLILAYKLDIFPDLVLRSTIKAGYTEKDPQINNLEGWTYYAKKIPVQLSVFVSLVAIPALAYFSIKKGKNYELLLIWIVVVYLLFTLIPNKNVRYSLVILPPFYFALVEVLRKFQREVSLAIIILLITTQAYFSYILLDKFNEPIEKVANYIFDKVNGNVGIISENNKFYSSAVMFYFAKNDEKRETQLFRPCLFDNKTTSETNNILRENNVEYLILVENGDTRNNTYGFENITLEKKFGSATVYRVNSFEKNDNPRCTYICVLNGKICEKLIKGSQ